MVFVGFSFLDKSNFHSLKHVLRNSPMYFIVIFTPLSVVALYQTYTITA